MLNFCVVLAMCAWVYRTQCTRGSHFIAAQHAAAAFVLSMVPYAALLLFYPSWWLPCIGAVPVIWWYSRRKIALAASERILWLPMMGAGLSAIVVSLLILFALLYDALLFFKAYGFWNFLLGTVWSPQQVAAGVLTNVLGCLPLLLGSMMIAGIAMCIALPLGVMTAIWLHYYAPTRLSRLLQAMLQTIAGIPSVVFGFFAALTIAPMLQNMGNAVGLEISSESALAAGIVIGWMVTPYTISMSLEALRAVPVAVRDGSLALGATLAETIVHISLPTAFSGLMAGALLSFSRAIGETMVVVMAAGMVGRLSFNPLESVTTVTVQIAALLTGDQQFDSPKTRAAFALGLLLFCVTLIINFTAIRMVKRHRAAGEKL